MGHTLYGERGDFLSMQRELHDRRRPVLGPAELLGRRRRPRKRRGAGRPQRL
jgi:hypothetical protein